MKGTTAALLAIVALAAWPVLAEAAPSNDDFANAEMIGSLPFTDTEPDMQNAGSEVFDDPLLFCRRNFVAGDESVWYRYTSAAGTGPANPEYLQLSTIGSTYDTNIEVFASARTLPDMVLGGCADRPNGQEQTVVRLDRPSTDYYVEISSKSALSAPATLNLGVSAAPRYTVTSTADTTPGPCNSDCTLREAVIASNASPGAILLPGAGPYTLGISGVEAPGVLDSALGDLDFTGSALVEGTGATPAAISAGGIDRVAHLGGDASPTVAMRHVELADGDSAGDGGGLLSAAGFADLDGVTVRDSVSATNGGGIATGSTGAPLRVARSVIRGNTATGTGGGLPTGEGGGLFLPGVDGDQVVLRSTISGNGDTPGGQTPNGGGLATHGNVTVAASTISGNFATEDGGGAFVGFSGLTLMHTTVGANSAGERGGGLHIELGGANVHASALGGNAAPIDPNCSNIQSPSNYQGTFSVRASADSCVAGATETIADPQLRPLGDYGGPTPTQPPAGDGPAVDFEPLNARERCLTEGSLDSSRLDLDQRGLPMPVDGDADGSVFCDAGAVEGQPPACQPASLTIAQDTPGEIALPCSDPDGDAITALTLDTAPAKGVLSGSGLSGRTYTPQAGATGADSFTFHATAAGLDSSPATATIVIVPADKPDPPVVCCTPPLDRIPPTLTGARLAKRSVLAKRGALLRATLSEAATLEVRVARRTDGRRVRGRCRPRARTGRRCTLTVVRRRLTLDGHAGANAWRLRLARLPAGRYTLSVVARDAAGNAAAVQRLALTIRRPAP